MYLALLIPERKPPAPVGAGRRPFSWNRDAFWSSLEQKDALAQEQLRELTRRPPGAIVPEQFAVILECEDEAEQKAMLERFHTEGLKCRALVS